MPIEHFVESQRQITREPRDRAVNSFQLGQLPLDLLDTTPTARLDGSAPAPPLHRAFGGPFHPGVVVLSEQRRERDEILVGQKVEMIGDLFANLPFLVAARAVAARRYRMSSALRAARAASRR